MAKKIVYDMEEIVTLLPHRPPFLFVDHVTSFTQNVSIETERYLREDESFFTGHFPNMPIMPGVLVTEALAQTSGLLWGLSKKITEKAKRSDTPIQEILFLAAANIKYKNPAYPDDTLHMISYADRKYGSLYRYNVEAIVKRKVIARGMLTLAIMKGKL